jgi:hypothetical protein
LESCVEQAGSRRQSIGQGEVEDVAGVAFVSKPVVPWAKREHSWFFGITEDHALSDVGMSSQLLHNQMTVAFDQEGASVKR